MNNPVNTSKSKWWISPLFLISLAIFLAVLNGFFPWRLVGTGAKAKYTAAKTQIGSFAAALEVFNRENSCYPSGTNGLNDLVVKPAGATNWHQYLDKIPQDPWGHPYIYECPGKHRPDSYDLCSPGPDGKPGNEDDMVNW